MGQKTNPIGFRLGVIRSWNSIWYEDKKYASWLHEDIEIRDFIKKKLFKAGISRIKIERKATKVEVFVYAARPGMIFGQKGDSLNSLTEELRPLVDGTLVLRIEEVRKVDLDATLVAENAAAQLERRVAFRRAMKRCMQNSMKAGAQGIRISASGRLGGAEMGRYEWYREGRVPLHTLRAEIDYGTALAKTSYGVIGIKCWIFKGEQLPQRPGAAAVI